MASVNKYHIAHLVQLALETTGQEHEVYQEDVAYIGSLFMRMSPAKRLLAKARLNRAKKLSKNREAA